jgi:hypothetical protein
MRSVIPTFTIIALGFTSVAFAQTSPADHAAHHSPSENSEDSTATVAHHKPGVSSEGLVEHMGVIRDLMVKAEHAKDAKARERLLAEHMVAMRDQIDGLKSMSCGMSKMKDMEMGKDKPAGNSMMMSDGMGQGGMMKCHEQMETRVALLTELLEQTWRRETLLRSKR